MSLLRIAAVLLAGWLAMWWWTADERENNRHINPEIFPAFRAIEDQCMAERFPHETVRCKQALRLMQQCTGAEHRCSATDYYASLMDMGFDLPPLYQPGYRPR